MAKQILVIDDSPTDTAAIKVTLQGHGYVVLTADNGRDGITAALEKLPDLIIMDIVMPEMNGFKATRELHKNPKTSDIPIIMLSTKDQPADIEWAKRQGATDYLIKSADNTALIAMIEKILSSQERSQ